MMKALLFLPRFLFLGILILPGLCQSPFAGDATEELSLSLAVKIAVEKNQELEATRRDQLAAQFGKNEAISYLLPQVKLNSDVSKSQSDLMKIDKSSIPAPYQDMFDFSKMGFAGTFYSNKLQFGQLIYDRSVIGQIRLAEMQKEAAGWQKTGQEQQVVFETVNSYLSVLMAQELFGVQQQRVQLAEKQLQTAQSSFEAGIRIRTDVLRAELSRSSAMRDVVSAEIAMENAQVALNKVMGIELEKRHIIHSGELGKYNPPQEKLANARQFENFFSLAKENNPSLKLASVLVKQSKENVGIARGEHLPRVTAGGSYGFKDSGGPHLDDEEWAVQAAVEIPIFEGGRVVAKVNRTKEQFEAQKKRYENAVQTVLSGVEQASLALQESFRNLDIAEKSEIVAKENYERFQNLYKEGLANSLDITQALTELVVSQTDVVTARYAYLKIFANLLLATGKIPAESQAYETLSWLDTLK